MEYNKRQFQKANDKKVLHKVKKHWVVMSMALLMAIGGEAAVTHLSAHASTTDSNTKTGNTNAIKERLNQSLIQARQASQRQNQAQIANQRSTQNSYNTSNIAKQADVLHQRILHNATMMTANSTSQGRIVRNVHPQTSQISSTEANDHSHINHNYSNPNINAHNSTSIHNYPNQVLSNRIKASLDQNPVKNRIVDDQNAPQVGAIPLSGVSGNWGSDDSIEDGNAASYTLSSNGTLTVSGGGTGKRINRYADYQGSKNNNLAKYENDIKSIVFKSDVIAPSDCSNDDGELFPNQSKLQNLNVEGLNTSNVTNSYGMYSSIPSTTQIEGKWGSAPYYLKYNSNVNGYTLNVGNDNNGNIGGQLNESFNSLVNSDHANPAVQKENNIKSLDFSDGVIAPSDCSASIGDDIDEEFFPNQTGLELMSVSGLNASKVTNMNGMFSQMGQLTCGNGTLNLNFHNVPTNLQHSANMFNGDSKITTLKFNPSGWLNTNHDSDMSGMFGNMPILSDLDLGDQFNTSDVNNMSGMFQNDNHLSNPNLVSNFNTGSVTNMDNMLNGTGITTLNLGSNFNTSRLQSANNMLPSSMTKLTGTWGTAPYTLQGNTLTVGSGSITNFSQVNSNDPLYQKQSDITKINFTGNVTAPSNCSGNFFPDQSKIKDIDGINHLNMSNVSNMNGMFANMPNLSASDSGHTLTLDFATPPSNLTDISNLFNGDSSLQHLDLTGFNNSNTQSVQDMSDMFNGMSGLQSLNLNNLNTASAQNMNNMFNGDSALQNLTLGSKFNTQNVNNMSDMFNGLSSVHTLDLGSQFTTASDVNGVSFNGNNMLSHLNSNAMIKGKWNQANYQLDLQNKILNVSDGRIDSFSDWKSKHPYNPIVLEEESNPSPINIIKFVRTKFGSNVTVPSDCSAYISNSDNYVGPYGYTAQGHGEFFPNQTGVTNLDLTGLDTSNAHNMEGLFSGMKGLSSLDLDQDNLNTNNVTNTANMFRSDTNLTTLKLGNNFNTSNDTNMQSMFSDDSDLGALNLGTLFYIHNGGNVNMSDIFSNMTKMHDLHVGSNSNSHFNTNSSTIGNSDIIRNLPSNAVIHGTWGTANYTLNRGTKTLDVSDGQIVNFGKWSSNSDHPYNLLSLLQSDVQNIKFTNVTAPSDCEANQDGRSELFPNQSNLKNLNLSGMTLPSNVHNLNGMLSGLSSLTNSDFGLNNTLTVPFKTNSINNTANMFNGDSSLQNLTLGTGKDTNANSDYFDTSNVSNMQNMFSGMNNLKDLDLGYNFNTRSTNSSQVSGMLNGVDVNKLQGTWQNARYSLLPHTGELQVTKGKDDNSIDRFTDWASHNPNAPLVQYVNGEHEGLAAGQPVQKLKFIAGSNVIAPSDCTNNNGGNGDLFPNQYHLATDRSKDGLKDLNVDGLDPAKPNTNMHGMFAGMIGLTNSDNKYNDGKSGTLNLGYHDFNTRNVTDMSHLFDESGTSIKHRALLNGIDFGPGFNTTQVQNMSDMFVGGPTKASKNDAPDTRKHQHDPWKDIWNLSKVNFRNDPNFTASGITNQSGLNNMFSQLYRLSDVSLDNNFRLSSNVKHLNDVFNGLYDLRNLSLGNSFNTSDVSDMSHMFSDLSSDASLNSLNLGNNFNTSNVSDMNSMFHLLHGLGTLHLNSDFNTSKVHDMGGMFESDKALSKIYFGSHFDVQNVSDMSGMFENCGIPHLNLTNEAVNDKSDGSSSDPNTNHTVNQFKIYAPTTKLSNMGHMFAGASSLQNLRLNSDFNTSNVNNMDSLFSDCGSLNNLHFKSDDPNFDTSRLASFSHFFKGDHSLTRVDFDPNFITSNANNMNYMFSGVSIPHLILNLPDSNSNGTNQLHLDTTNVTGNPVDQGGVTYESDGYANGGMSHMFDGANINQLDLKGLNTNALKNTSYMFANSSIGNINSDIYNLNTHNVRDMRGMFQGVNVPNNPDAHQLDAFNLDTTNASDMESTFQSDKRSGVNQIAFTKPGLNRFNTSKVTNMSYMFSNDNLPNLNISDVDTSKVDTMSDMFAGAEFDKALNFGSDISESTTKPKQKSKFNTNTVHHMRAMFSDTTLPSLNLSDMDTRNVWDMSYMFSDAQIHSPIIFRAPNKHADAWHGLNTKFDTSRVQNMQGMFERVYSGEGQFNTTPLDLSCFRTKSVTNMENMFNSANVFYQIDTSRSSKGSDWSKNYKNSGYPYKKLDPNHNRLILGNEFDTSNVTNIGGMFASLPNAYSIGFAGSDDINLGNDFKLEKCNTYGRNSFNGGNPSDPNSWTPSATAGMFQHDTNLHGLDLSHMYPGMDASDLLSSDDGVNHIDMKSSYMHGRNITHENDTLHLVSDNGLDGPKYSDISNPSVHQATYPGDNDSDKPNPYKNYDALKTDSDNNELRSIVLNQSDEIRSDDSPLDQSDWNKWMQNLVKTVQKDKSLNGSAKDLQSYIDNLPASDADPYSSGNKTNAISLEADNPAIISAKVASDLAKQDPDAKKDIDKYDEDHDIGQDPNQYYNDDTNPNPTGPDSVHWMHHKSYTDGDWFLVTKRSNNNGGGVYGPHALNDGGSHPGYWFRNQNVDVIVYVDSDYNVVELSDAGPASDYSKYAPSAENPDEAGLEEYAKDHKPAPDGYQIDKSKSVGIQQGNTDSKGLRDYIAVVPVKGDYTAQQVKIPAKFYNSDGVYLRTGEVPLKYSGDIGTQVGPFTNANVPPEIANPASLSNGFHIKELTPGDTYGTIIRNGLDGNPADASNYPDSALSWVEGREPTAIYVYQSPLSPINFKNYSERIPYQYIEPDGSPFGGIHYINGGHFYQYDPSDSHPIPVPEPPKGFTMFKGMNTQGINYYQLENLASGKLYVDNTDLPAATNPIDRLLFGQTNVFYIPITGKTETATGAITIKLRYAGSKSNKQSDQEKVKAYQNVLKTFPVPKTYSDSDTGYLTASGKIDSLISYQNKDIVHSDIPSGFHLPIWDNYVGQAFIEPRMDDAGYYLSWVRSGDWDFNKNRPEYIYEGYGARIIYRYGSDSDPSNPTVGQDGVVGMYDDTFSDNGNSDVQYYRDQLPGMPKGFQLAHDEPDKFTIHANQDNVIKVVPSRAHDYKPQSPSDVQAEGRWGDAYYTLDNDGTLTLTNENPADGNNAVQSDNAEDMSSSRNGFHGNIWPSDNGTGFKKNGYDMAPYAPNRDSVRRIRFVGNVVLPSDSTDIFNNMNNLESFDGTNADASNVQKMNDMFKNDPKLASVTNFGNSGVGSLQYANNMFMDDPSLNDVDLSHWNNSSDLAMTPSMFESDPQLDGSDIHGISDLNISNVKVANNMFASDAGLTKLNLGGNSSQSDSSLFSMGAMFKNDPKLHYVDISKIAPSFLGGAPNAIDAFKGDFTGDPTKNGTDGTPNTYQIKLNPKLHFLKSSGLNDGTDDYQWFDTNKVNPNESDFSDSYMTPRSLDNGSDLGSDEDTWQKAVPATLTIHYLDHHDHSVSSDTLHTYVHANVPLPQKTSTAHHEGLKPSYDLDSPQATNHVVANTPDRKDNVNMYVHGSNDLPLTVHIVYENAGQELSDNQPYGKNGTDETVYISGPDDSESTYNPADANHLPGYTYDGTNTKTSDFGYKIDQDGNVSWDSPAAWNNGVTPPTVYFNSNYSKANMITINQVLESSDGTIVGDTTTQTPVTNGPEQIGNAYTIDPRNNFPFQIKDPNVDSHLATDAQPNGNLNGSWTERVLYNDSPGHAHAYLSQPEHTLYYVDQGARSLINVHYINQAGHQVGSVIPVSGVEGQTLNLKSDSPFFKSHQIPAGYKYDDSANASNLGYPTDPRGNENVSDTKFGDEGQDINVYILGDKETIPVRYLFKDNSIVSDQTTGWVGSSVELPTGKIPQSDYALAPGQSTNYLVQYYPGLVTPYQIRQLTSKEKTVPVQFVDGRDGGRPIGGVDYSTEGALGDTVKLPDPPRGYSYSDPSDYASNTSRTAFLTQYDVNPSNKNQMNLRHVTVYGGNAQVNIKYVDQNGKSVNGLSDYSAVGNPSDHIGGSIQCNSLPDGYAVDGYAPGDPSALKYTFTPSDISPGSGSNPYVMKDHVIHVHGLFKSDVSSNINVQFENSQGQANGPVLSRDINLGGYVGNTYEFYPDAITLPAGYHIDPKTSQCYKAAISDGNINWNGGTPTVYVEANNTSASDNLHITQVMQLPNASNLPSDQRGRIIGTKKLSIDLKDRSVGDSYNYSDNSDDSLLNINNYHIAQASEPNANLNHNISGQITADGLTENYDTLYYVANSDANDITVHYRVHGHSSDVPDSGKVFSDGYYGETVNGLSGMPSGYSVDASYSPSTTFTFGKNDDNLISPNENVVYVKPDNVAGKPLRIHVILKNPSGGSISSYDDSDIYVDVPVSQGPFSINPSGANESPYLKSVTAGYSDTTDNAISGTLSGTNFNMSDGLDPSDLELTYDAKQSDSADAGRIFVHFVNQNGKLVDQNGSLTNGSHQSYDNDNYPAIQANVPSASDYRGNTINVLSDVSLPKGYMFAGGNVKGTLNGDQNQVDTIMVKGIAQDRTLKIRLMTKDPDGNSLPDIMKTTVLKGVVGNSYTINANDYVPDGYKLDSSYGNPQTAQVTVNPDGTLSTSSPDGSKTPNTVDFHYVSNASTESLGNIIVRYKADYNYQDSSDANNGKIVASDQISPESGDYAGMNVSDVTRAVSSGAGRVQHGAAQVPAGYQLEPDQNVQSTFKKGVNNVVTLLVKPTNSTNNTPNGARPIYVTFKDVTNGNRDVPQPVPNEDQTESNLKIDGRMGSDVNVLSYYNVPDGYTLATSGLPDGDNPQKLDYVIGTDPQNVTVYVQPQTCKSRQYQLTIRLWNSNHQSIEPNQTHQIMIPVGGNQMINPFMDMYTKDLITSGGFRFDAADSTLKIPTNISNMNGQLTNGVNGSTDDADTLTYVANDDPSGLDHLDVKYYEGDQQLPDLGGVISTGYDGKQFSVNDIINDPNTKLPSSYHVDGGQNQIYTMGCHNSGSQTIPVKIYVHGNSVQGLAHITLIRESPSDDGKRQIGTSTPVSDLISGHVGNQYVIDAKSFTPNGYQVDSSHKSQYSGLLGKNGLSDGSKNINFYYELPNSDGNVAKLKPIYVVYVDHGQQVGQDHEIAPIHNTDYNGEVVSDVTRRADSGWVNMKEHGYSLDDAANQNLKATFNTNESPYVAVNVKRSTKTSGSFVIVQNLYDHGGDKIVKTLDHMSSDKSGYVGSAFQIHAHDYDKWTRGYNLVDPSADIHETPATSSDSFTLNGLKNGVVIYDYQPTYSAGHHSDNANNAQPIEVQYYNGSTSNPANLVKSGTIDGYMGETFNVTQQSSTVVPTGYQLALQGNESTIHTIMNGTPNSANPSGGPQVVKLNVTPVKGLAKPFTLHIVLRSPSDDKSKSLSGSTTKTLQISNSGSLTQSDFNPDSADFNSDSASDTDNGTIKVTANDSGLTPSSGTFYYIAKSSDTNVKPITVRYYDQHGNHICSDTNTSGSYMNEKISDITRQSDGGAPMVSPYNSDYTVIPDQNLTYTLNGQSGRIANVIVEGNPNAIMKGDFSSSAAYANTAQIEIVTEDNNGNHTYHVSDPVSGHIGDSYTIMASDIAPRGYRVDGSHDISLSGTIKTDSISKPFVKFYYVPVENAGAITVRYVNQSGTTVDTHALTGKYGDSVNAFDATKTDAKLNGYDLSGVNDSNYNYVYNSDTRTITIDVKGKLVSNNYTVDRVDQNGNALPSFTGRLNGRVGDVVYLDPMSYVPNLYKVDSSDHPQAVTLTNGTDVSSGSIKFKYDEQPATAHIIYKDVNGDDTPVSEVDVTGAEGSIISYPLYKFGNIPQGFEFDHYGHHDPTIQNGEDNIIYVSKIAPKKIYGTIVMKYYDIGNDDQELTGYSDIESGVKGELFDPSNDEADTPDGYSFAGVLPGGNIKTFNGGVQYMKVGVVHNVKPRFSTVNVKYVDKDTSSTIDTNSISGATGDNFYGDTFLGDIPTGYHYVGDDGHMPNVFTNASFTIYVKRNDD